MANWAKLQEDLVGLPVAKRAKHGIHFQKGANEFVANFSGKPCHHFADGIWKPIDTKLVLLPDGFYGCPHSKVKVHPDGRVAVTGSNYQQRAELPSAKTGLADGDKLIREFSFGKQEMRITEDGFRSEITLNRIPTLTEARKLIASESGTLSKEYLKSLTTATDANGDSHTFSTLSAFRTWLASATFPVVIDPDFSSKSAAGDALIVNNSSAKNDYNYGVSNYLLIGEYNGGAELWRTLIKFDLASLPDGAIISAASLGLYQTVDYSTNAATFAIYRQKRAWLEGTRNGANDNPATGATWNRYDTTNNWSTAGGFGADDCEQDAIGSRDMANNEGSNAMKYWTLTPTSKSALDLGNGWLIKSTSESDDGYQYGSSESSNVGNRPILAITYTAGGTTGNPLMHRWRRI